MIYLLTGMPGNGKTLYAVDFIVKARKAGRDVYSDIEGLEVEGVKPAPDDWRDAPDGALIVYDEAHRRFPQYKGRGRSPLEVVQEMDTHRHRGIDMMMITQWPDKIDGELFRLVGKHQHLNRAMGLQRASVVTFSRGTVNPYSATARKGADEEIWEFPQHLYNTYKSSSMHTDAHKFKLPSKVKGALITVPIMLVVLWGVYRFFLLPDAPAQERSEAEPTQQAHLSQMYDPAPGTVSIAPSTLHQGAGTYAEVNTETVPVLSGCASSHRGCRCWNADGWQLDLTQSQCYALAAKPLPINILHGYSSSSSAGERDGDAEARIAAAKGVGQEGQAVQRYGDFRGQQTGPDTYGSGI